MGKRKKKGRTAAPPNRPIDPGLIKLLVWVAVLYVVVWAVVGSMMGAGFAALFATPFLGIALFLIARWDRHRQPGATVTLRHLLSMVPLNLWNILFIVITIVVLQQLLSAIVFFYLSKARAEFLLSAPDRIWPFFDRMTDDFEATVLFLGATILAHFGGGFLAAYLPNKKFPSPYLHASVGSIFWSLISLGILIPLMTKDVDSPSQPEAGLALLAAIPACGLALLGAWVALGTRSSIKVSEGIIGSAAKNERNQDNRVKQRPSPKKPMSDTKTKDQPGGTELEADEGVLQGAARSPWQRLRINQIWTRRRVFVLSASVLPITLVAVSIWIYRLPDPVNCSNPPNTASLNYWPVTYQSPAETCHDYPLVQARFAEGDYARTREDWERGLKAPVGKEIYVLIYINNGAATDAENLNPGRGIARNVRLKTQILASGNGVNRVEAIVFADNARSINGSYTITTDDVNARLELIPSSGGIFDYVAKPIKENIDIGNNTILVGDLSPTWDDSKFIRFRLRVIAEPTTTPSVTP
jgi:hypothetical protein